MRNPRTVLIGLLMGLLMSGVWSLSETTRPRSLVFSEGFCVCIVMYVLGVVLGSMDSKEE